MVVLVVKHSDEDYKIILILLKKVNELHGNFCTYVNSQGTEISMKLIHFFNKIKIIQMRITKFRK